MPLKLASLDEQLKKIELYQTKQDQHQAKLIELFKSIFSDDFDCIEYSESKIEFYRGQIGFIVEFYRGYSYKCLEITLSKRVRDQEVSKFVANDITEYKRGTDVPYVYQPDSDKNVTFNMDRWEYLVQFFIDKEI